MADPICLWCREAIGSGHDVTLCRDAVAEMAAEPIAIYLAPLPPTRGRLIRGVRQ